MKKILTIVFFCALLLHAADIDSTKSELKTVKNRTVFFTLGILCVPDALSAHIGFQLNKNWSIALKGSIFFVAGSIWSSDFIGARISCHLNDKFLFVFNTISMEVGKVDQEGGGFELTTGYENTSNKFFSFYWAVGISGGIYKFKYSEPVRYLPVLKWGINLAL